MKARFVCALIVAIAVVVALPLAADERSGPVGRASVSAAGVDWQFGGNFEKVILVIATPNGETITRELQGSRASFRAADLKAAADGTYHYELRAVPRLSDEVRQRLAAARAADDDAAIAKVKAEAGLGEAVVQSGVFTIKNGSFVSDAVEPPAAGGKTPKTTAANAGAPKLNPVANDVVTADDEIIQGSLCVGLDCVNNESFGFDTIRLKENNTRIKFDDTSTSAGFPNNDWQLTANDSASGGANKFSIEDITGSKVPFTITAGAPTNSLFVASTGKVGVGNSAPVLHVHITATDTPAIRQEQTNGGGFTAQTWDIGANEANWFVRDVTGGSRLPLRIRPGAPTSSVDISADGDVGVGTASPNANTKVDINDSIQVKARIALTGQEFFQPAVTSTDGVALILGVNQSGDKQLWVGDTALLTQNATNPVIRLRPNTGDISVISTNATPLNLLLNTFGGNVGVGTASPTSKLHVTGDVRVTGGSFIDDGVTLTAPDYVFDSSYKLMPIEKLAEFVRNEKHLPNVPSASNIKADGLNMSQFQMRLLEKVEELTLYTIDLKAQNDALQKRLASLEQQIKQQ